MVKTISQNLIEKMTLQRQAIILGVVLFIAGCTSVEGRVGRILGGKRVLIENYPYQASLRDVFGVHFCGGAIISEKHILTAAHCVSDDMGFDGVVTGTSSRTGTNTTKIHSFSKVDVYPGWVPPTEDTSSGPIGGDLAVITLKDKIVFDKNQQKIDLPTRDFEEGHLANFTGWGLISQEPVTSPYQLQWIETKLVSQTECQKKMTVPEAKVKDVHVCAFRSPGYGLCFGDSGGPLAVDGQIVGVFSWTDSEDCGDGFLEIFTNVYKYKDFIENIMNNSE